MAQLNATNVTGALDVGGVINAGSNIRMPNNVSIGGYRTDGSTFDRIGYINTENKCILGYATNGGMTQVRSPGYVTLLCNEGTAYDGSHALRWYYYSSGSCNILNPSTNGQDRLGSSSFKWSQLYASTSTISTSDRNFKKNIQSLDDRYMELFDLIEPVSFQFTDGTRIHTGFIAQDVEVAMEKVGLTDQDLAFFCKDIATRMGLDNTEDEGKEIPIYNEDGTPKYIYSLRYEEYIAIMAEKLKRLEKRVDKKMSDLEERIKALEEKA